MPRLHFSMISKRIFICISLRVLKIGLDKSTKVLLLSTMLNLLCLKSFAMKCGLKQSNSDLCLFLDDEKSIYLIVHVDDGIIASVDEQTVKQFLEKLKSEFSVVIGVANYFLGMQIKCLGYGDICSPGGLLQKDFETFRNV
ncbi:hypothetical protein AVEN_259604-1 [Araneus ventricosus]|uniref:Reverse transcriptase Ty1/copia-type domain-containing protein n=1 Tax=Araneus ventricosus TaxID=182803 RepID=A0A4Y2KIU6_ARAVE|nr:hypothetical protein AVEN_259604-1 [Araneus ventricosus]